MNINLKDLIPKKFKNYKLENIKSGASYRNYYRLSKNKHSVIYMDSSKQPDDFNNFLHVHKILSKTKISVPQIFDINTHSCTMILEDLGTLRFDRILNFYHLKDLLYPAIKTLVLLKNKIKFNKNYQISVYNFDLFKKEISEFIDFFYPYSQNKTISAGLKDDFYGCWKEQYDSMDFDFQNFVHKDYNLNNLIFLPKRKNFNKCGVIDFQNALWSDDCWDLFSLLEDSRLNFDDQYNDHFIKFFFKKTNQKISLEEFRKKYFFLNCSRQTRLLGRWVKLANDLNQKCYLDFIDITNTRLIKSLKLPHMIKLKLLYKKILPDLYD